MCHLQQGIGHYNVACPYSFGWGACFWKYDANSQVGKQYPLEERNVIITIEVQNVGCQREMSEIDWIKTKFVSMSSVYTTEDIECLSIYQSDEKGQVMLGDVLWFWIYSEAENNLILTDSIPRFSGQLLLSVLCTIDLWTSTPINVDFVDTVVDVCLIDEIQSNIHCVGRYLCDCCRSTFSLLGSPGTVLWVVFFASCSHSQATSQHQHK